MNTGTILIVDDNKGVLASLELLLENYFSKILTASNPNQITALLTTRRIDVVILDMNFSAGINNGNEGLYWLGHIRQMAPTLPVVMLTAYGDVELAVKALKNGAADFLLKPWDNQTLIDKVTEAYHSRKAPERTAKVDRAEGFEMLVGRSPAMLQLMKVVSKVARTDANILITGENGTGKEILAREIHRLSPRGARPMLNVDMGPSASRCSKVNCSDTNGELSPMPTKAVPESLKRPTAVHCSWTNWATSLSHSKPSSSPYCKAGM